MLRRGNPGRIDRARGPGGRPAAQHQPPARARHHELGAGGAADLSAARACLTRLRAITVRGDDITVDFTGVRLEGLAPGADPDRAAGVPIRVEGAATSASRAPGSAGYRIGDPGTGVRGLTLIDNDASHNWKPRLYSLIEHESLVDWLSFHNNEKDEWLRYGGGLLSGRCEGGRDPRQSRWCRE